MRDKDFKLTIVNYQLLILLATPVGLRRERYRTDNRRALFQAAFDFNPAIEVVDSLAHADEVEGLRVGHF
ncbi:MAG: hypothetical protein ACRENG_33015, partial [bacterium]